MYYPSFLIEFYPVKVVVKEPPIKGYWLKDFGIFSLDFWMYDKA